MCTIKDIGIGLLIFFGCGCLVHGYLMHPYCEGEIPVGFVIGGLIFAIVFFYVDITRMKNEKVWG